MGVERPALRGAVTALTPTLQMMTQPFDHIQVELVEATAGMAVAEVATPSFQEAIHLVDQLRDRHEVPLPGRELANRSRARVIALVEGVMTEIAMVTAESVAVVSQCKTQKVQALSRFMQLDDSRFLAVDGEPKSPL